MFYFLRSMLSSDTTKFKKQLPINSMGSKSIHQNYNFKKNIHKYVEFRNVLVFDWELYTKFMNLIQLIVY